MTFVDVTCCGEGLCRIGFPDGIYVNFQYEVKLLTAKRDLVSVSYSFLILSFDGYSMKTCDQLVCVSVCVCVVFLGC